MRKVDKNKLDAIGRTLIKADVIPDRDLEKIVSNPALFDAVRMRIALGDATARSSMVRPAIAVFASVAIIAVVGFALFVNGPTAVQIANHETAPPAGQIVREVTRFSEPDRVVDPVLPPVAGEADRIQRASERSRIIKRRQTQRPEAQVQSEGDFYALSYAGDPNETERGGRIIRVDMPRSTLFAMGVDIPLENETETVKADLLIGNDGVARAIRVVK